MKILIEFFSIGPTYTIFKMRKQLWIGHPGGSYGMIKAKAIASFHHILDPGFGGNSASVLSSLTKTEQLEGLDRTGSFQRQFSHNSELVNSQPTSAII